MFCACGEVGIVRKDVGDEALVSPSHKAEVGHPILQPRLHAGDLLEVAAEQHVNEGQDGIDAHGGLRIGTVSGQQVADEVGTHGLDVQHHEVQEEATRILSQVRTEVCDDGIDEVGDEQVHEVCDPNRHPVSERLVH